MMMVVVYKEINTIRTTSKIIKINVIIRNKLVRLSGRDKQGRYSALSCVFNYDWNCTDFSVLPPLSRLLFPCACLPAFLINLFSSIYFRGNHKAAHKDKSQVKLASLRYIHTHTNVSFFCAEADAVADVVVAIVVVAVAAAAVAIARPLPLIYLFNTLCLLAVPVRVINRLHTVNICL